MAGCFLDTTIVVNIADKNDPQYTKSSAYIATNQPAIMPYYALRELLVGYVQILCDSHNAIQASDNPAEALIALLRLNPMQGRKKEARIKILAEELKGCFDANQTGQRDQLNREMLQSLALRVNSVWRRAKRINGVSLKQPLGCFNDGKITYGESGELRGPNDSFNCHKDKRCAAAGYLSDDQNVLLKLIEALHPNNLPLDVANKNENQKRRKALKELQTNGPKKFNKGRCRALGDAYFAAMCPPGSVVLTSNLKDHEPLCEILNKKAVEP